MWKKNQSVFQDHVKYIHNDIVKPFIVVILQYAERVREMQDLENSLHPPSMKVVGFESASWYVRSKEFNQHVIQVSTKDRLPTSIQD